jgi:Fanconi anemia group J protein
MLEYLIINKLISLKTMPYGVLLFVPSYSLLSKLLNRWNETNFSDKIRQYKEIFSETRVAKGFDTMLREFYECIDNSSGGEFHNGALMIAVYRGRASEGLDFSDNYARAVIAVGIPYPSIKDVQVDLKRKYNNTLCRQKNLLNGDEWYEIQAYRAINQGLGRCIRHRKDWGAIILVDDRYFKNPQKYMKGN